MNAPKRLTRRQALKLDSYAEQFLAAGVMVLGVIGLLGVAAHLTGLCDIDLTDALGLVGFAWAYLEWNYWHRRAREAEKPLPPNQAIITYSTPEAAAAARWIEDQWSQSIEEVQS